MLTIALLGLGSNLGKGMNVCQCIVPVRHEGTLNIHRATSPLVRLVEGKEKWEAPSTNYQDRGLSQIVPSSAWCSKLQLTTDIKNKPLFMMNLVWLDLALLIMWH
ncbi:hypothetical protein TNCV_611771 [Trichonephila clavipes]|nr:hypothetical protein TNCV_611771 [Trichonephila clavipes]